MSVCLCVCSCVFAPSVTEQTLSSSRVPPDCLSEVTLSQFKNSIYKLQTETVLGLCAIVCLCVSKSSHQMMLTTTLYLLLLYQIVMSLFL